MAESSRREVRAGVSKMLEQSEMDLENLRIGKQRLVSKKKRMSSWAIWVFTFFFCLMFGGMEVGRLGCPKNLNSQQWASELTGFPPTSPALSTYSVSQHSHCANGHTLWDRQPRNPSTLNKTVFQEITTAEMILKEGSTARMLEASNFLVTKLLWWSFQVLGLMMHAAMIELLETNCVKVDELMKLFPVFLCCLSCFFP